MDKNIYNNSNSRWYELQGNYFMPSLTISEKEQYPIGALGWRHLQYIQEYRK